jgi:hydrogenase nickel incorporation protein HypA/HybF
MHEVSIMAQTLEIALENAAKQDAQKIHRLKMRIGTISGVVPEALNFAFDVVTEGTIAQGANLEIEIVQVICYCSHCQIEFQPPDLFYECPQCDRLSNKIIAGREIELTSLEVS